MDPDPIVFEIQKLQKLKMEPWMGTWAVDSHSGGVEAQNGAQESL